MAEEVGNFPLDQGNTSALRGLEQYREEVGQPRRLDDAEEDLRNPGRAREAAAEEERDVSRPARTEDRVEITQDAFDHNQEEAAAATNNLGSKSSSRDASRDTNNDVADAPEQQNIQLQQRVESDNAEVRGTEEVEVQEGNIFETRANIPETRAEQRAEVAQEAARNEPPLDIPAADVGQIEEVREPLQEAQDTNPLRAPGPSEIRDEPDATAIETERGQNVSSLI